jgi:hypothetical protein
MKMSHEQIVERIKEELEYYKNREEWVTVAALELLLQDIEKEYF